jgi:small subunit ribosomal protein S6
MTDTALHEYELVFIARPNLGEDGVAALNGRLAQLIAGQSGQIQSTEIWGKRTLAYPIRRFFEGVYVLHRLAMAPQGTTELERFLRFNEDVLRYLIVRTDE